MLVLYLMGILERRCCVRELGRKGLFYLCANARCHLRAPILHLDCLPSGSDVPIGNEDKILGMT